MARRRRGPMADHMLGPRLDRNQCLPYRWDRQWGHTRELGRVAERILSILVDTAWREYIIRALLLMGRRTGCRTLWSIRVRVLTFLRFQDLEHQETAGEIGGHVRQPGEEKTGSASEGLGMEQLVALREGRRRVAAN